MKKTLTLTLIIASSMFTLTGCLSAGYSRMVIDEADKNGDKLMTFKEYHALMTNDANAFEYKIQAKGRGKTVEQYAREEFNKMDSNKDGLVNSGEVREYTFK